MNTNKFTYNKVAPPRVLATYYNNITVCCQDQYNIIVTPTTSQYNNITCELAILSVVHVMNTAKVRIRMIN
jgi:ribulose-5-phosphate 4-epimerase/fuculose-1-phosphate aldolase